MTPKPDLQALEKAIAAPRGEFHRDYLQVKDLRVSFDGFVAVDGVDLVVTSGDLRFLIGPNGAGKRDWFPGFICGRKESTDHDAFRRS